MYDDKTIGDLIGLSQDVFRGYGFRCDNMVCTRDTKSPGYVVATWDREPATGMAAFSVVKIQPKAEMYIEALADAGTRLGPEDLMRFDRLDQKALREGDLRIRLKVSYNHHSGGGNGIDRMFVMDYSGTRLVEFRT